MTKIGTDEYGRAFKVLADGRALHVTERFYNSQMTLSQSVDAFIWEEGW